jgi:hypothetical protein
LRGFGWKRTQRWRFLAKSKARCCTQHENDKSKSHSLSG